MSQAVGHPHGPGTVTTNLTVKLAVVGAVMTLAPVGVWLGVTDVAPDRGLLVAAAGVAVELVGIGFVYLFVIRDLYRFHDLIHDARNGNYDAAVDTHRSDLIGYIFQDFAEFRDELADYAADIERRNRRMNEAAAEQAAVMDACARGDLTERMDADTGIPQLDTVAYRFNGMMDNLETLLAAVQRFNGGIVTAEERLHEDLSKGEAAAETIRANLGEIDDATDRQSAELDRATDELDDLAELTARVAEGTDSLARAFDRTTARATDGRESARAAYDAVESIETRVEATEDTVRRLEALTREIGDLVDDIDGIAEGANSLANVLSTRATFESSRPSGRQPSADDRGEAFEVLADRVGEFVEDTRATTDEIKTTLSSAREETATAVEDIRDVQTTVDRSAATVEETLDEFDRIASDIEDANDAIIRIGRVADHQASTADSVVDRVGEVSEMSDRTAALAEEVATASTHQTDALEGAWSGIRAITNQARQLSERLDRFETRADAAREGDG